MKIVKTKKILEKLCNLLSISNLISKRNWMKLDKFLSFYHFILLFINTDLISYLKFQIKKVIYDFYWPDNI